MVGAGGVLPLELASPQEAGLGGRGGAWPGAGAGRGCRRGTGGTLAPGAEYHHQQGDKERVCGDIPDIETTGQLTDSVDTTCPAGTCYTLMRTYLLNCHISSHTIHNYDFHITDRCRLGTSWTSLALLSVIFY